MHLFDENHQFPTTNNRHFIVCRSYCNFKWQFEGQKVPFCRPKLELVDLNWHFVSLLEVWRRKIFWIKVSMRSICKTIYEVIISHFSWNNVLKWFFWITVSMFVCMNVCTKSICKTINEVIIYKSFYFKECFKCRNCYRVCAGYWDDLRT